MNSYLDTKKSVIISAPAGSGKTERLARRFIALLQDRVPVERILAITFTDKAAAEMKQRILKILRKEDETLFHSLLGEMPLMRVSTIHSFCGTLLRRFSFETGIAPDYGIEEAVDSRIIWDEIIYEVLMDAGKGDEGHDFLLQTLGEKGFRGLDYLQNTMDYLFQKSPFSLEAEPVKHESLISDDLIAELRSWPGVKDAIEGYEDIFDIDDSGRMVVMEKYFLTEKKEPRKRTHQSLKHINEYQQWSLKMYDFWKDRKIKKYAARTAGIFDIYRKCLNRYNIKKNARGILDFSDLEYLAFKTLTENPEWANILYAFDEKTDHILVDEFQDTNTFQWAIIDRLTEEWRSGMGAKREEGIRPTIFFVGDEKQSVYFFRGANVEIFQRAKEQMETWLKDEFCYEEAKENFRSLPAIIEFTNHVFSKIMQTAINSPYWQTRYSPFSAHRSGHPDAGKVELVILDTDAEGIEEEKKEEAAVIARMINGKVGNLQLTDRNSNQQRQCRFMDVAILLRKRTHLKKYEDALRQHDIPFVAVKGIGFYQEPEIAMLRAFVYFLSNTKDDYSLYILLKSPLFGIDEDAITLLVSSSGNCLFDKLHNACKARDKAEGLEQAAVLLKESIEKLPVRTVAEIIEDVMVMTKAWRYFHEPQRKANVKKFIRIIEDLEASGKSVVRIRDFLERTFDREDEPKANVNTEGMDAVRIMTIHASKGLEFPVVFIPGLEESFTRRSGDTIIFEKDSNFILKSLPEPSIRHYDEDFILQKAKEEEELKRLFYVAVTRAEEALIMTGRWNSRGANFMEYLKCSLAIEKQDSGYVTDTKLNGFKLLTSEDISKLYKTAQKKKPVKAARPVKKIFPFEIQRSIPWKAVTETADIRRQHGKDWLILGDVIHRIFELVSKGVINDKNLRERACRLLESGGLYKKEDIDKHLEIIERDVLTLKEKEIWQSIIVPRENSYTELPFVLEDQDTVYTGRIDRLIIQESSYNIYDYKTYPVKETETGYLLREYAFQMNIYKKAVRALFNTAAVRSFIVFTHIGEVKEV